MLGRSHLTIWFVLACVTETLCATYFLNIPNAATFISIMYFIAGMAIGLLMLFFSPLKENSFANSRKYPLEAFLKILLVTATAFFLIEESKTLFRENPLDYRNADMLPVIKSMNERFLHGQWKQVYDTIPQIWGGSKPIYLPFMWLPFLPAVAMNIDLRWITVIALCISFAMLIYAASFGRSWKASLITCMIAAALLWWLVSADDQHGFISLTEEGIIVLFYLLLAWALMTENILLIAITACLCMMSRYAGVGFVPAFLVYLLFRRKKRELLLFALIAMAFLFFFFIIPFGWKPLPGLLRVPGYYVDFSKTVWKDSPDVFTAGLGFARFFVPGKIYVLHRLLIVLTFITPAAVVGISQLCRKKINVNNVPLAVLKIALVVFYNFIDVPYLYLFYTSSFVSLFVLLTILKQGKGTLIG